MDSIQFPESSHHSWYTPLVHLYFLKSKTRNKKKERKKGLRKNKELTKTNQKLVMLSSMTRIFGNFSQAARLKQVHSLRPTRQ